MTNAMFSFGDFNFGGVHDIFSSTEKGFDGMEAENNVGKQVNLFGAEEWGKLGEFGSVDSDHGFYGNDYSSGGNLFPKYQQEEQQQPLISYYGLYDAMQVDPLSMPFQACLGKIAKLEDIPNLVPHVEPKKEKRDPFSSLAGLDLLNSYGSGFKRLNGERNFESSNYNACTDQVATGRRLSTEEIMRVAGARFIQTYSQVSDVPSMLSHPFGSSFSGLSYEEARDVELVEFLLVSAEKVGYQQYERAGNLLKRCDSRSSSTGNPVERVVHFFSEALREKIDRETGRVAPKVLGNKQSFDVDRAMKIPNDTTLACQIKLPFGQVVQFAGIQAIVENVAEAKKVHVIDLEIRNGVQWTGLMQALASRCDCLLELLKITAVGTTCRESVEETGKRLGSFAQTMNLPFCFKIVMVEDMLDLKEDMFELDFEETVVVYSQFALRSMVPKPDRLESAMKVIKNIRPCLTVVTEVEANHNSPVFVTRFIDALFYFAVYFDCLETCIQRDDPNRSILESMYFGTGIRNIVANEGEERNIRNVKIDVWRAFFARYGMEEIELSSSSLYQADLILKNFPYGNSCTLNMDGKCLLLGWKGTPLHSLSLWKFL
uniref:DELLA protein RGL1 n=1 Tax=Pyrus pyrifolia TaxID=3767 RepID=A0A192ADG3_PYRPY|nr:DELLA protein RGL1 [Pyrus pyrifolia]